MNVDVVRPMVDQTPKRLGPLAYFACFRGIVWREVLRFLHQRERFFSALVRPLVWLFIFAAGRPAPGLPPVIRTDLPTTLANYADPLPQALVLTAIVISFAMTALFLVVLLALRGLTGTDHVDGEEDEP